ncbi:MAG: DedA family protein [Hyphomicrobiales bacterium]|nr:DedA family protein [Hyphomicrobiales bacterium]MDE2114938.1 DedA family protein [Hyphomicrobiales bacterium]
MFALHVHHLITTYGYLAVFVVVIGESAGIPLPGETMLVSAAIYAGTTHNLNIWLIIGVAIIAAILGDNCGYWVGRRFGARLLLRHGGKVGIDEGRIKLGQYLFLRHGGLIVFFGRFVAVLRTFAALLAGVNRYNWERFLIFNGLGGICWAALFGLGGYVFGNAIHKIEGPVGMIALVLAVVGIIATWLFFRHHEAQLQAKAEAAFPGPLTDIPH